MKHLQRSSIVQLLAYVALLLIGSFLFIASAATTQAAMSDYPTYLTGYLWSGTQNATDGTNQGVGWISLHCENDGSCATTGNYGVRILDETNNFRVDGYAWAGGTAAGPAIGWVRFGQFTGCPANATGNCDSRVNPSTNELEGWARACSVFASDCSGALKPNDERGDWDGWISLNCTNNAGCGLANYGVRVSGTGFAAGLSDYAWGDDVVGMITWGLARLYSAVTDPTDPDGNSTGTSNPGPACYSDAGTTYSCINPTTSRAVTTNVWCSTSQVDTACVGAAVCSPVSGMCELYTPGGTISVSPSNARRGSDIEVTWTGVVDHSTGVCEVVVSDGGAIPITGETNTVPYTINANVTTFTVTCGGIPGDSVTVEAIGTSFES